MEHTFKPANRDRVRKIVFRTGRGLGDAVLCEPLVRALKNAFLDADLTVVVPSYCRGIAELGYRGDRFVEWVEADSFELFADQFDLAIDADPARYSEDFRSVTTSGADLIRLFAHYRADAYETTAYERMAEGLERIGVDALHDVPTLCLGDESRVAGRAALDRLPLRGDAPLIVVHPGSSSDYAFKRWTAEGFAFVADKFMATYGSSVVLVGTTPERELIGFIRSVMQYGPWASCAENWNLIELAALLVECDLFIGNDSGVGHLAAALGRPVVTIAGPTYAHFWAPLTNRALITDPAGCCYDTHHCDLKCLRSIRAFTVLGGAEALMTAMTGRDSYECLDPIHVADKLETTDVDIDGLVLRNTVWDMPLTVQRGRAMVLAFLDDIRQHGSTRFVRSKYDDGIVLMEQLIRHGIVLPGANPDDLSPEASNDVVSAN